MDFNSNLLTQRAVLGIPCRASVADISNVMFPVRGRNCLIVDGSRTDAYTELGTQVFPFKTIQAALNAAMAGTTILDLTGAVIQGALSLTKTNFLPATSRGVAVCIAPGAVFNTTTASAISANGYVALDLRGATFTQAALAVTGSASIDRSRINMKVATSGTSTAATISPPLPAGATYTVALAPASAVAAGVSSETVSGFNILLATGGGTTDVTVTRI